MYKRPFVRLLVQISPKSITILTSFIMLLIYLLGFLEAVDRAFATGTACPATESTHHHRTTRRHASNMIYRDTPTCSKECVARRDASEFLNHEAESTMVTSTTAKPSDITTQESSFYNAKATPSRTGLVPMTSASLHPPVPRADAVGPNVQLAENKAFTLDFSSSMPMSTRKLFDTSSESSRESRSQISLETTVIITNTRNPWQTGLPGFDPGTPVGTVSIPPSSSYTLSSATQPPSTSMSAYPPFVPPALSKGEVIGVVVGVIAVLFAAAMLVLLCRRRVPVSSTPSLATIVLDGSKWEGGPGDAGFGKKQACYDDGY
ncbi:hypothetical protein EDB81DRAFT_25910 [Dactylonectria macrodidyma]|uniref:Uncharacterized protein n=1 Tax=Dactylonectria macrodidyma TaxID=307937 RepID=A0A9P9JR03_9HYPO|nr:hypothetical protein EDB81DRAFT_25910 [Dactylonectria macrodidyma]